MVTKGMLYISSYKALFEIQIDDKIGGNIPFREKIILPP